MAEGTRPGGLTALAVLNFISTAISLLICIVFVFAGFTPQLMYVARKELVKEGASEEELARHDEAVAQNNENLEKMGGPPVAFTIAGVTFLFAVLLLISGVGYLKLSPVWGRGMGNAFGATGILGGIAIGLMGSFNLGVILLMIYPALTLILLNTTFRDDFAR